MASCNPQTYLTEGKCLEDLNSRQLQLAQIILLCQIYNSGQPSVTCDPQTILDENPCLSCYTIRQLKLIQTQMICDSIYGNL